MKLCQYLHHCSYSACLLLLGYQTGGVPGSFLYISEMGYDVILRIERK